MKVISLGWGVQSWAMAAMSALGELPPVDLAIHADTGWELNETLVFARKWTPWLERHGVQVVTVDSPYRNTSPLDDRWVTPPFYTSGPGGAGMLYRTCTDRWKVRPMKRWIRRAMDEREIKRKQGAVQQWIGITLDEAHRANPDMPPQYIENTYPFLEMLDRPWTRGMVIHWLRKQGLDVPVSSSCIICPYRDDLTWRRIKQANNVDWERAVAADRAIRDKRPGYKCYLHRSCKPIEDVRFGIEQISLW